jgi:ankyrin repeat protein
VVPEFCREPHHWALRGHAENEDGEKALNLAEKYGQAEVVRYLKEHGAK